MIQKSTTLAHVSDLHLSPRYFPERSDWFRSSLEQCLVHGADHIVITGDITNQARPEEFEHFRKIVGEFNLLDSSKATVVIGNHDIFGGPYHAEDVLEFPSTCKTTLYHDKVNEFYRYTKELFTGVRFLSEESIFPFVKTLGDIAIVGMNSVAEWSPLKNPLGSNGMVYDRQFNSVKSYLRHTPHEESHVFIAMHHHFHKKKVQKRGSKLERLWSAIEAATIQMRKKKRLLKLFSETGVDGILHGHVHRNETYVRKKVPCYNGGGTIVPAGNGTRMINYFSLAGGKSEHRLLPVPGVSRNRSILTIAHRSITTAA